MSDCVKNCIFSTDGMCHHAIAKNPAENPSMDNCSWQTRKMRKNPRFVLTSYPGSAIVGSLSQ